LHVKKPVAMARRGMASLGVFALTAYFNPMGYRIRYELHERFVAHMRDLGIPLLVAECALEGQEFCVNEVANPFHVRARSKTALFLKENLLKLALARVPEDALYVCWMDDDLTFLQPKLAEAVVAALQEHPAVQMFEECEDLDEDGGVMGVHRSAAAASRDGGALFKGVKVKGYHNASHTGYCWACRKDVLDACGGFLDICILGSADAQMSFLGMLGYGTTLNYAPGYKQAILEWQQRAWDAVGHQKLEHCLKGPYVTIIMVQNGGGSMTPAIRS
jgi:hypothetical protein